MDLDQWVNLAACIKYLLMLLPVHFGAIATCLPHGLMVRLTEATQSLLSSLEKIHFVSAKYHHYTLAMRLPPAKTSHQESWGIKEKKPKLSQSQSRQMMFPNSILILCWSLMSVAADGWSIWPPVLFEWLVEHFNKFWIACQHLKIGRVCITILIPGFLLKNQKIWQS